MDDAYTEERLLLNNRGSRAGNFLPEYQGGNLKQTFFTPYAGYGQRFAIAPENQYNNVYNFRQLPSFQDYELHRHAPVLIENDLVEERTLRKLEFDPLHNTRKQTHNELLRNFIQQSLQDRSQTNSLLQLRRLILYYLKEYGLFFATDNEMNVHQLITVAEERMNEAGTSLYDIQDATFQRLLNQVSPRQQTQPMNTLERIRRGTLDDPEYEDFDVRNLSAQEVGSLLTLVAREQNTTRRQLMRETIGRVQLNLQNYLQTFEVLLNKSFGELATPSFIRETQDDFNLPVRSRSRPPVSRRLMDARY